MHKRDQELLAKQLWSVSSPPQNNAIIGLTIIAVFLAGIGIGDILSKSKQANTNYAAMVGSTAMIRVFVETPKGRDSAGFTVPGAPWPTTC